MQASEKRKLENMLIVMGLKKLNDPELIQELAQLIPDHHVLKGMLNECEPEKRSQMYEAIRPHLKFKPKPLDAYMAEIRNKASEVASRAEPIKIGDGQYLEVPEDEATGIVATVTCYKCTRQQQFYGSTMVEAALNAREAGWVRDLVRNKEICPTCPAPRPN